ncbi:MAG: mannose-6-phosphate isomerase [Erysipelotrichaceae bacterium]|nr:mannose-6-phosphate isomerase [Erysipelotrichaceae bacterium]
MSILFFKSIPRPAIWGHTLVKDYFGYDYFPDGIGQSWAFSAQKDASTICLSDPYKNITLLELWENHRELFGNQEGVFPVIISLVGPEDDLSIQVHPDTEHAKKLGYPSGKNEAWYFIETKDNASIVYGHNAKDKQDLMHYINDENYDDLIRHLDVHTGDFVYLPAGLLHALKKGSIVYEIQQATDITYRFYDYHRKDDNGNERELHLQQAIDCLSYNLKDMKNDIHPFIEETDHCKKTTFISNDSFTVTKLEITGDYSYHDNHYQLATVVEGDGYVDSKKIKLGDNFLIPYNTKVKMMGQFTLMMTTK